jgi:hypothetical protein
MKRALLTLTLFCGLFQASYAQTTLVSGMNVVDNTGAKLSSGQWCFGSSCFAVTSGSFSGSVTPGTATVTVTGAAGTYLDVPNVTVAGSYFLWDSFTAPSNATITGLGVPRIVCTPGAMYAQTDGAKNAWQCIAQNGSGTWNGLPAPQPAAMIHIGTVTTGAPGSAAAVTNSGSNSDAILNFTLPQGIQGPIGAPTSGVNLTPPTSQNVVQPAGTTMGVNSFNSVLSADGFAGSDIGARINAAFASQAGTSATPKFGVLVKLSPGVQYFYSTPIVIPNNTTAPYISGPVLDCQGALLMYTGSGDASVVLGETPNAFSGAIKNCIFNNDSSTSTSGTHQHSRIQFLYYNDQWVNFTNAGEAGLLIDNDAGGFNERTQMLNDYWSNDTVGVEFLGSDGGTNSFARQYIMNGSCGIGTGQVCMLVKGTGGSNTATVYDSHIDLRGNGTYSNATVLEAETGGNLYDNIYNFGVEGITALFDVADTASYIGGSGSQDNGPNVVCSTCTTAQIQVTNTMAGMATSGYPFVNNQTLNQGYNTGATTPTYTPIITLPASSAGSGDQITIRLLGEQVALPLTLGEYTFRNRGGFTYGYTQLGVFPQTEVGIKVYAQTNGTAIVYLYGYGNYDSSQYSIELNNTAAVPFTNGNASSATPTGTLEFDSTNPATYPPYYAANSSGFMVGGGLNAVYRCTTAGPLTAVGALTITLSDCGSSAGTDTGLRVK